LEILTCLIGPAPRLTSRRILKHDGVTGKAAADPPHLRMLGVAENNTKRRIGCRGIRCRLPLCDPMDVFDKGAGTVDHEKTSVPLCRRTQTRPVYRQNVMQLADGSYAAYTQQVGTEYSHSSDVRPAEYTINAQVGIIAKLVDVETAEIVWIGSLDEESSSALDAADYIARSLVKSFTKELAKLRGE